MDQNESYFLSHNKLIEEKVDHCIHNIDSRLDKLHLNQRGFDLVEQSRSLSNDVAKNNLASSFLHFKAPYIRDFRNFSGPSNNDVRQIRDLTGTENVDELIKNKLWTKESKQQLKDAVLEFYERIHNSDLIKQKNALMKQIQGDSSNITPALRVSIGQKLALIEEQREQVKSRKEQRIFVPEERNDPDIDWCAISARLTNTHHDALDCRLMWSNSLHWSINDSLWMKEEDECLLNAVEKYGKNDWDSVASELNNCRLPWQCCARYNQELNSIKSVTPIAEDDTEKIVEVINLCRIGNFVPWNQVMYFIQYHNLLQVKYQWQKLLSEKKSNLSWSPQEDLLLLKTVSKFGDKDWNRIANYIPGRSNKSCRERYMMRLRFQRRAIGNWKSREDETLLNLIAKFGTNWTLIAANFPERNNHQLRCRYELLKNDNRYRIGPIKHKKLYRNSDGLLVRLNGRPHKPESGREIDERLYEIFDTYQHIAEPTSKSLVCRSPQDEFIYHNLIAVLRKAITGADIEHNLLSTIIEKALRQRVSSQYELFTPSASTLKGYKAWMMQQQYLNQFCDKTVDRSEADEDENSSHDYNNLLKIVVSLFLWPAILSKIEAPEVNVSNYQAKSIIERDAKNLYKIRSLQNQIVSHSW